MAASVTQNPQARSESKSAMKKKAKAEAAVASAPAVAEVAPPTPTPESNYGDGSYESPYIKELYKNIRNVNKKISNASKVDNILEQNPGKSLDELVASRKINADQKAQILKKPSLQASLAHLEEQIAQYKKFDQEYKARAQVEKAAVEKELTEKSAKELEETVATVKAEAAAAAAKEQHESLLIVSQFLRLAAARRAEEVDQTLDENQALEGVLVEVYTGDDSAVTAMARLINGSDEQTTSINGEKLSTTYAQIKATSVAYSPPFIAYEEPLEPLEPLEESSDDTIAESIVESTEYPIQSDPTIANAGFTELDAIPTSVLTNGHEAASSPSTSFPPNSGFGEGANAAAEASWDTNNDLSASSEWVDVRFPRDAAETETGVKATPAAPTNTQSWADEQPHGTSAVGANADAAAGAGGDGFHEVQRSRATRDGQHRGGRGGRGGEGYRGRGGFRGGRGGGERGRGGARGGANRGPRPQES